MLPLKKAAEEKAQAMRAAAASSFKSMLKEQGDITINSRWSRVWINAIYFDLNLSLSVYKCTKILWVGLAENYYLHSCTVLLHVFSNPKWMWE